MVCFVLQPIQAGLILFYITTVIVCICIKHFHPIRNIYSENSLAFSELVKIREFYTNC